MRALDLEACPGPPPDGAGKSDTRTTASMAEPSFADFLTLQAVTVSCCTDNDSRSKASAADDDDPRWLKSKDFELKNQIAGDVGSDQSQDGRWHHAAAHTVTVVLGAGVLSLPYAMRWLGLGWGIALLALATAVSYYSSYLLAMLAVFEHVPFTKYRDLGKSVFGERAGLWIVAPFQYIVLVGTSLIYIVLGGESLYSAYTGFCEIATGNEACLAFPQWAWTLVFIGACLLVAPLPSIHEASWISMVAACMSLAYGTMAIVTSSMDLAQHGIGGSCDANALDTQSSSNLNDIFQAFNAIGIVVFAYGGHSVLPEIHATLKPNPTTVKPMMKGITAAYIPTTAIYFVLAVTGYLAYGECTQSNVLLSSVASGNNEAAHVIALVADLLVAIHVFGSVQIFSQPMMQTLQGAVSSCLAKAKSSAGEKSAASDASPSAPEAAAPPLLFRCAVNCTYIAILGAFAVALPDASPVLGLVGGIAITWMTFVLPSAMYLVVYKDRRPGAAGLLTMLINACIIIVCTGLGLLATIGAGYTFGQ